VRTKVIGASAKRTEAAAAFEHTEGEERLPVSRWGLRDLGELCDHLHTAYNSPSRRSPSSTEAPAGAGPCCQRVAAELRRARAGAATGTGSHGGRLRVGGSKARGPVQTPEQPKVSPVVTHEEPRASSHWHHDAQCTPARNWQPMISVGDGRVAAGVSEPGPAMSDGESGFPANYSRPGSRPTILRDYSRRPRGAARMQPECSAPDYGAAEPGLSPYH
jgi:hypothetical protein